MMSITFVKAWVVELAARVWDCLVEDAEIGGTSGGYRMMQGQRIPPSFVEAL
jgi:hypothetical protein